ncbi:MAG: hypothetical protein PHS38_14095 [Bacteroidales bacterium]|nr:hypothetical protein [Bacteroidales bacterium]
MNNNYFFSYRTLSDIKLNIKIPYEDQYCILNARTSSIERVITNNPFIENEQEKVQMLAVVDNIIAGTVYNFPLKIKVDGKLYSSNSGSYLVVRENFRKLFLLGIKLTEFSYLKEYPFFIAGGISKNALPIHKYFGSKEFSIPRYLLINKSKFLLMKKFRLKGLLLKVISGFIDFLLLFRKVLIILYIKVKFKNITTQEVHKIPSEVDSIINKNSKKFQEFHNSQWFKWALKDKFGCDQSFQKKFYVIKNNQDKIIGFFLTSEKFHKNIKGYRDVYIGSVMEWETVDEKQISEKHLLIMAMMSFDNKYHIIECATNNKVSIRLFKKIGMFKVGQRNMIIKPLYKMLPDEFRGYDNINNWRIRPAVGDTIMY